MNKIPMAEYIDKAVRWIGDTFGNGMDVFSENFGKFIKGSENVLQIVPWWVLILIFAAITYKVKGWKLMAGTVLGLYIIYNLQLWNAFLSSLVLVIISAIICILIGIPLGIASGRNNTFHKIISPILDLMQTLPSFVYLIPALLFFGIGKVPAVFATVIFAMPPAIRLTDLGIRQVPIDLIEVGQAFGSTPKQLLFKIQLPLALPTVMSGINQTIMLSLSMAVIASMIGAGGLGGGVLEAIGQLKIGMGFEYGIAVVIMAIILDRITQSIGSSLRTEDK